MRDSRVIHAPALKSGRESEGVISAACPDVDLHAAFHGVSGSLGEAETCLAERLSPADTPDMVRDLHAGHINNDCRGHDNPGAGQPLHDAVRASLL